MRKLDVLLRGKKGATGPQGQDGQPAPSTDTKEGEIVMKNLIITKLERNKNLFIEINNHANKDTIFQIELANQLIKTPQFMDTIQRAVFRNIPYDPENIQSEIVNNESVINDAMIQHGNIAYCRNGTHTLNCERTEIDKLQSVGALSIGSNIRVYNNLDVAKSINIGENRAIRLKQFARKENEVALVRQGLSQSQTTPGPDEEGLPQNRDDEQDIITDTDTLVFNERNVLFNGTYMQNINSDSITCKRLRIGNWTITSSKEQNDEGDLYVQYGDTANSSMPVLRFKPDLKDVWSKSYSGNGNWYTKTKL